MPSTSSTLVLTHWMRYYWVLYWVLTDLNVPSARLTVRSWRLALDSRLGNNPVSPTTFIGIGLNADLSPIKPSFPLTDTTGVNGEPWASFSLVFALRWRKGIAWDGVSQIRFAPSISHWCRVGCLLNLARCYMQKATYLSSHHVTRRSVGRRRLDDDASSINRISSIVPYRTAYRIPRAHDD